MRGVRVWTDEPSLAAGTLNAMAVEVKEMLRASDDSSNPVVKVRGPPNLVVTSQNKVRLKT